MTMSQQHGADLLPGRRARTADAKHARRTKVVDTAIGFLESADLETITVASVARGAGIAKGTVYLYFRTKEELFLAALERLFAADPPAGASVAFVPDQSATGWNAPPTAPWLARALEAASLAYYGQPAAAMGEGGTIPFMAMLGQRFPAAQFLITGVLGPHSNAHGPNEFLHIPYATRLTACVAQVLAAHAGG